MKSIDQVIYELQAGDFVFSSHAHGRAVERDIGEQEITEAGENACVIESYRDDKYGPSALLLGYTGARRPLHIVVSLAESTGVKIVTIYEPDPDEWIADAVRRR